MLKSNRNRFFLFALVVHKLDRVEASYPYLYYVTAGGFPDAPKPAPGRACDAV